MSLLRLPQSGARLAFYFCLLGPIVPALEAATPLAIAGHKLNSNNEFVVTATIPTGSRHAILETLVPSQSNVWRPMLATSLTGSTAVVEFRVPRGTAKVMLARVRAGAETTYPAPVLNDPAALTVVPFVDGPTEREKADLLFAAGAKMRALGNLSRAERQQQTAAWILAQNWSWVQSAETTPTLSSIAITLTDGSTLLLMNPPKPDEARLAADFPPGSITPQPVPESEWGGLTETAASSIAPRVTAVNKGLPESRAAICAFSLEEDFPDSGPAIYSLLESQGYLPEHWHRPRVDDVLDWFAPGPVGVLFWHSHGITYKEGGKHYYAIALTQSANLDPGDQSYLLLRKNNEVGLAHNPEKPGEAVYTLNHRFIRNHMKFAPHSVVVLDACDGANPLANLAFRSAGAGIYASWDAESGKQSGVAIERMFDRLLGTNQRAPFSYPPERPFALPEVTQWMAEKGYDKDPTFNPAVRPQARMKFQYHHTNLAHILRPSIRNVEYDAGAGAKTCFRLQGDFGKDLRGDTRIHWGSRELTITDWQPEPALPGEASSSIAVDLGSAPYPVGDFKVEIRGRHESNETPMTQWNIPFTYKLVGKGSLQYTITTDLKLRMDVHGFRAKPQDPITQPFFTPFGILDDCTGTITASGSYSEPPPTGLVAAWSGGSQLKSYNPSGAHSGNNFIQQTGYASLATGQIMSLGWTAKGHFQSDGFTIDGAVDPMTPFMLMPQLNTTNWSVTGNTVPGDASFMPHGVSASTTWPARTPSNAPEDSTPR